MKILWLSNCVLNNQPSVKSGSWLFAMREIIGRDVHIVNITEDVSVKKMQYTSYDNIEEFVFPHFKLHNGLPNTTHILNILDAINQVSPDIIHIWGTERYWALLLSRGYLQKWKVILEIQGLMNSCADVFYAGLTPNETRQCHALKDIVRPSGTVRGQYKHFLHAATYEQEILSNCHFISTQSDWVRDQISLSIPSDAKVYKTLLPIRKEFILSRKWTPSLEKKQLVIFTSVAYSIPFKGLHILLKAVRTLKIKYPNVVLKIAGLNLHNKQHWRLSGYERLLLNIISEYNLQNNIEFLGRITALQTIENLLLTDIYVNTSFVESYSAAAAEALYLGVPSVLAYSGAMPNFSAEVPVCLYYSPMDYVACAAQIDKLHHDKELYSKLTTNAISVMNSKCDFENIRQVQLNIYNDVINHNHRK